MKLGYIILYVPKVDEAVAFYEAAFGLECRFTHEGGDYAEMETGETVLAFASEELADSHGFAYRKTTSDGDAPSVELALVTDDVQSAFDKAIAAGAAAAKPPTKQPWGQTVSYLRDANGYLVEICSPVGGPTP
ncbi:VOC family protein [Rubripirellula reticaptiva]|uniref:Glyoxalase-like domain protein n=1 Tax=Rubripirellula reticaptiva TaxID=2528013 RepID=A0A5C6EG97_9BACT|nr:VOC family protein [Rubripirellula reticaptiva]TWU46586.1 Glyoxalase-like domain protein [Rubripirellula reticaptiva]